MTTPSEPPRPKVSVAMIAVEDGAFICELVGKGYLHFGDTISAAVAERCAQAIRVSAMTPSAPDAAP